MDDIKKALTLLSESNNRLTGAEQLIYSKPVTKKTRSESWIKPYMMLVESEMAERVTSDQEPTPPGINRLTGKPVSEPTASAPDNLPQTTQPLSSRYDPAYKGMPAAGIIDIGGQQYKFAGREAQGPGTGKLVKVPAAAIGIRGLGATQVELGQDGMYYLPGTANEDVEYLPPDPETSAQLKAQSRASANSELPKQQAAAFIRYSSGLYDAGSLPKAMTIKPGVTLPIRFNPVNDFRKDSLANAVAANKLLPPELQLSPQQISQIIGQSSSSEDLGERMTRNGPVDEGDEV